MAVLLQKAPLEAEEAVGQEKQLAEEVAEEGDRLLLEVAALVLMRWVAEEVVQAGQHFREEVGVEAFLQQQRSRLGRKNPSEEVEVGHLHEQAVVVGPKEGVCLRKEAVH